MSAPQTPGVYVVEVPPAARPITGVGTSTAAFVGIAGVDPAAMPELPSGPTVFRAGNLKYTHQNRSAELAGGKWPVNVPAGSKLAINGTEYKVDKRTDETHLLLSDESRPGEDIAATSDFVLTIVNRYLQADKGVPQLVTSWAEFTTKFGTFTQGNEYLAHAVFGFFNNGGSRCYVTRLDNIDKIEILDDALQKLQSIDEVSIVAAPFPPGVPKPEDVRSKLLAHCHLMEDRIAVLDGPAPDSFDLSKLSVPTNAPGYGAYYFPWLLVSDPLHRSGSPTSQGPTRSERIAVPPSGHVAGVYARTDATRGVHKAPANEQVLGVSGLAFNVTKNQQGDLNVKGVNCIRDFYGSPLIWGARTVASDATYRYVNVRRYMNFLRESLINGIAWAVFEPNSPALWKRLSRSVGDFLLGQWREGALFGDTPQKGFYVRCDETTNPPDVRDQGLVVIEIGVAIVKPAEFVVVRIQQQSQAGG